MSLIGTTDVKRVALVGELAAERDRLLIELLRTVKSQDASHLW